MKSFATRLLRAAAQWTVLGCCAPASAATYVVTNLNASGTGSFAAALASAESDGVSSRIEFSVGGTINPGVRKDLTAGNCEIDGSTAPAPGITFDLQNLAGAFRILSSNNVIRHIRVINTAVNVDGIELRGSNNTIERCTFEFCQDEAVGITQFGGYTTRGNVVAFCRIENCGSQADPWSDGRGILVTENASATIVGNYVHHSNRGITVNGASSFADIRNNKVTNSLSPASGSGITIVGPSTQANVIDCVASNNALQGFRYKTACVVYKSGNTGSGNGTGLEGTDADVTIVGSIITVADTPYPGWLVGAATPVNLSDVGMGTGGSGGGGGSGTFYSDSTRDGYLKESTESSGIGGTADTTGAMRVGDTGSRQQQIGLVSFDTSAIPDGATITAATLTVARTGIAGTPTSLGTLTVDIKNGFYGTDVVLRAADFEAASTATNVGTLPYPSSNNVPVSAALNSAGCAGINKTGVTQLKIRFTTDDDNDSNNDYLTLYDGANATYKPKLDVTWQ